MSSEFYSKTGGVTLLVIKHKGTKFDYVNGFKDNLYFSKWNFFKQFMEEGKCYVVACSVVVKDDKVNMTPFGIAFECESEEQAKNISHQHTYDVNKGAWDARKEYEILKQDWDNFLFNYFDKMKTQMQTITNKTEKVLNFGQRD
jgi:hypothetical protein